MQQSTVDAVQDSWAKVTAMGPQVAELFYKNLFSADPALRSLFKSDMTEQGQKLVQMITAAVDGLQDVAGLVPALESLAIRHAGYGVVEEDYKTVGSALLSTLEQCLGADFTPEVSEAWASVYGVIADVMTTAAHSGSWPDEQNA